MKRYLVFCLLGFVVWAGIAADDKQPVKHSANRVAPAENQVLVPVAAHGTTQVDGLFGDQFISVKVTTHEIDIGKPGDSIPEKKPTNCTYGRHPCSLVDNLEVTVTGKEVVVARSVYADLADVNWITLRQKEKGKFVLKLTCGDASEAYATEVIFDKEMVRQRERIDGSTQAVSERTIYFSLPVLDD